jgi:uncharacterized protein
MEQSAAEPQAERTPGERPALALLRDVVIALAIVTLAAGLHAYLAFRLVGGSGLGGVWAVAGYVLFGLLFASIPAGFAATRRGPAWLARPLLWMGHLWIGLFALCVTAVAGADLLRWIGAAFFGPLPWSSSWSAGAVCAVLAAAVWGFVVARGKPRLREHTVPINGLGEGLHGLRIVQISDIHIGPTLDGRYLERLVHQVNALEPDVVAVTGDLVDGFVESTRGDVAALAQLRAAHGVFYVTGNHEYYYDGPQWEDEVRRLGLTVLKNEHRTLERNGARLAIAGVSDHDAWRFGREHASRPDIALSGVPPHVPRILLAHQPRTALRIGGERVDLQLSGHTHGGQIFPFMFFVRLQQPVVAGLRTVAGVRVYAHRGTGYWGPPLRVGSAPEIAVHTLVSEE